jgi:hypothetical protein
MYPGFASPLGGKRYTFEDGLNARTGLAKSAYMVGSFTMKAKNRVK